MTATARRAVAYYRVSTSKQGASGLGIEAQRAAVHRFAETEGFEIIAEHLSDDVDVVWTLPRVPHDEELEGWLAHEVDIWGMDRQNAIAASAAVRRSVWLAAGGQPTGEANEDHAFWIRVRNASGRFKQVMQTTWTYRLDPAWSHRSRGGD
jgi:hypothetical protein